MKRGLKRLLRILLKGSRSTASEEKMKEIVKGGEEAISKDEAELISSIFELGETPVEEVMVPRVDLVACEANTPMSEVIRVYVEKGFSRIPVYEESIDNTIGIIYAHELLRFWGCKEELLAIEFVRLPYFVPHSKRVLDTIRYFQKERISIAMVVDEYGGVDGAVTMEDLLEEIVGELRDEFDKEEPPYKALKDDSYVISARMELDELNQLLGTDFEGEEVHTFGGLIHQTQEKVPQRGEGFQMGPLEVHILEGTKQRIGRALVKRKKERGG